MSWKYDKLRGKIKEVCGTQDAFAEKLGIGRVSLSQRLNNQLEFSQDEIFRSCEILNIDISDSCIPFCYPYLAPSVEIADKLVEKLTADGKTIYRYWNNLPKSYNEYKFYSRLVPIPLECREVL